MSLRESLTYLFEDTTRRDAYFSANVGLLENSGGAQTVAIVGSASLDFYRWNGVHKPQAYDASGWVQVPASATTSSADTHYWGDPSTDMSMRARRDSSNGFLVFERRVSGQWVEKFKISNSATVDTMKFTLSTEEPVVSVNELGLYSRSFKDSENSNASILRPLFVDSNGNHFLTVGALPDGGLRVPQNVDEALNSPNIPLRYRHVLFNDDNHQVRRMLTALTGNDRLDASSVKNIPSLSASQIVSMLSGLSGDGRLDASAIKNLPAGSTMNALEIVALLETLTGADRLDSSAIKDLPAMPVVPDSLANAPNYIESTTQVQTIPNTHWVSIIRYQNATDITQPLPNINEFDNNQIIVFDCTNSKGSVTLVAYSEPGVTTQTVSGSSDLMLKEYDKAVLIVDRVASNWIVLARFNTEPVASLVVSATRGANDGFTPSRLNFVDSRITTGQNDGEYNISVCPVLEQGGETLRNKNGYNFVGDAIVVTQNTTNPNFADINFEGSRITVGNDSYRHPNIGFDSDAFELTENFANDSSSIGFKGIGINDGINDRNRAKTLAFSNKKFRLSENDSTTTIEPVWSAIPDGLYSSIMSDRPLAPKASFEGGLYTGRVYFDMPVVASQDIIEEPAIRTYVIAPNYDASPKDVVFYTHLSLSGVAPSDGYIELQLQNAESGEVILDYNYNPIAVRYSYKQNDPFKKLDMCGFFKVTQQAGFAIVAKSPYNISDIEIQNRARGNSCVCFQAVLQDYQTGSALMALEADLNVNLEYNMHFFGDTIFDLDSYTVSDFQEVLIQAGTYNLTDRMFITYDTPARVSIERGEFKIRDDNGNPCMFNIKGFLSAEETYLLSGRELNVNLTATAQNGNYRIYPVYWTGKADQFTRRVVTGINAQVPTLETGFTLMNTDGISLNQSDTGQTIKSVFTVPKEAVNIGFIFMPYEEVQPLSISIDHLDISSASSFSAVILNELTYKNEEALEFSTDTAIFKMASWNGPILEAINVSPTFLPSGYKKAGPATVYEHVDSGAPDENGRILFSEAGTAVVASEVIVGVGDSMPADGSCEVTLWFEKTTGTGAQTTYTKIDESERKITVRHGDYATVVDLPIFKINVNANEGLVLKGISTMTDCAVLISKTAAQPFVDIRITFTALDHVRENILKNLTFDEATGKVVSGLSWQFPAGSASMGDTTISTAANTITLRSQSTGSRASVIAQPFDVQNGYDPAFIFKTGMGHTVSEVQTSSFNVTSTTKSYKFHYLVPNTVQYTKLRMKLDTTNEPTNIGVTIRRTLTGESVFSEEIPFSAFTPIGGDVYEYGMLNWPIVNNGENVYFEVRGANFKGGTFDGSDNVHFGDSVNEHFFPYMEFTCLPIEHVEVATTEDTAFLGKEECYVSRIYGNDENIGSRNKPLKTIQSALNQGFAHIKVLPGSYTENLTIPSLYGLYGPVIAGVGLQDSPKVEILGTVTVGAGVSRFRMMDLQLDGRGSQVTFIDNASEGRHVFQNVAFTNSGSEDCIRVVNGKNWITCVGCAIAGRIALTGTGSSSFNLTHSIGDYACAPVVRAGYLFSAAFVGKMGPITHLGGYVAVTHVASWARNANGRIIESTSVSPADIIQVMFSTYYVDPTQLGTISTTGATVIARNNNTGVTETPPYMSAVNRNAQAIHDTPTLVAVDTIEGINGIQYDAVNHVLTVMKDGVYNLSATLNVNGGTGSLLEIWVERFDGSAWVASPDSGFKRTFTGTPVVEVHYIYTRYLTVGSKIRMRARSNVGNGIVMYSGYLANGVLMPSVRVAVHCG